MIVSKVEQDVIELFNRDITQILSINQIAKSLEKAYPHINSKVNSLIELKVLNKMQAGRSCLCSLNLQSSLAVALLSFDEALKKQKLEKKHSQISIEIEKIVKKFKVYTVFLSGKKIYFVLDHIYDKEAIKKISGFPKKIEQEFLTLNDFQNLLLEEPGLLKNKIVIYSCEKFYELADEIFPKLLNQVMFNE